MKSPIDERLQAEYKHPLRYLSEAEYRQYRNNYFREAVFTIGAGLLLVFTMILLNTGSYTSPPMQNQQDLLTVFFAGVVVFGLYRLLTIRRSVIQGRRDQLASEYPELRPKTTKKPFITASGAKTSPIIYYAWAALGITILAMIVAYLFI